MHVGGAEALGPILERVMQGFVRRKEEARRRLEAEITTRGALHAAARALYPHLVAGAEPGYQLDPARVLSYEGAERQLREHCQDCRGDVPDHWACEYPRLTTSGAVLRKPCPTRRAFRDRERYSRLLGAARLPARFARRTLDDFEERDEDCRGALAAARHLVENWGEPGLRGLLVLGSNGTGKTHLAAGIMQALMARGVATRFYTAIELTDEFIAAARRWQLRELSDALATVPLLVLDDLGKEFFRTVDAEEREASAFALSRLFEVINGRYEEERVTVVTSNLSEDEIARRYGRAVFSRMAETMRLVPLAGEDRRWRGSGEV